LLCLWYGGSYESSEDQVLFLARRRKGGRVWQPPEVVVESHGQPPGNAVIFNDGGGRIWIVWGRMESERPIRRGSGWGRCRLLYRTSEDDGHSWSADQVLHDELGWLPRNLPITLSSGELLLPLSGRVDGSYGSFFLKTLDRGQTWSRSGVVRGGSQPTMIERSDGALLMLMRRSPRIPQSSSHDGGATWTVARSTGLRNPGAGIAMRKLRNGHVLLVFNDTEGEPRSPLSVARSTDDGSSWAKPIQLESNPGEYSYPCILQGSDGRIHITYTCRRWAIKHVEMNEAWLTQFERPD
jgi:predicted neuraminidase